MCGIAGAIRFSCRPEEWDRGLTSMAQAIHHRGPDDQGIWFDAKAGIGMAHRRLSILDLSPEGHQPMVSQGGRYVIVFNGEIYNFAEIRKDLPDVSWRGHSDTEVMLAAFERWGIDAAIRRFVGMFAFALWDRQKRELTLVRDRLGEKPLYYGWSGEVFLFGSELKALRAWPDFQAKIDRNALTLLLRHNYIPAPYTIYQGFHKLLPGTFIQWTIDNRHFTQSNLPRPVPYWSTKEAVTRGLDAPFRTSDSEAVDALDELLRKTIAGQMVADVPLGAFLSGGIDSSTVVALMQAQSSRPVKTFTIGFLEEGYNEATHAKAVAHHLGTEHTELYVTPQEVMEVIPRLPELYDEPFSDSSQIPTFLVSQLTRQHVTVSLSGDGGDELFGGYNRYFWAADIWRKFGQAPHPLRVAMAGMLTGITPSSWDGAFRMLSRFLPAGWRYANPGHKLHQLAEILAVRRPEEIYYGLVSHWKQPAAVCLSACEPNTVLTESDQWPDVADFEHRMMYLDTVSYLPDDILVKVDRVAMAVSLETRVPFLDHRVVEFAWQLPLSMKIRNGQGKWVLRQVLDKYVPKQLIERPKMGFGVPIESWLRGPLRDWAETLLAENRLKQEGFFNPVPIRKKWSEHLSGQRNWQYHLWDVLMFQAWLEAEGR